VCSWRTGGLATERKRMTENDFTEGRREAINYSTGGEEEERRIM
jgi:hypothetical protein